MYLKVKVDLSETHERIGWGVGRILTANQQSNCSVQGNRGTDG